MSTHIGLNGYNNDNKCGKLSVGTIAGLTVSNDYKNPGEFIQGLILVSISGNIMTLLLVLRELTFDVG